MIEFTKEELYWIERTADYESSLILRKFLELNKELFDKLDKAEIDMIKKYSTELINGYLILKDLRKKLELHRGVGEKLETHDCSKEGCKEYH